MTPKEFRRYLDRDQGCLHCGESEAVSPNHRANRGMGGSKTRDVPSNIIMLCSYMNNAIEANARQQTLAKLYGWKLETWQDPSTVPVYDAPKDEWILLDDEFHRKVVRQGRAEL